MISVLGLMAINLLMIWGLDQSLFWKQVIFWLVGGSLYFLIKKLKKQGVFFWTKYIYLAIIVLILLPLFFGQIIRGSTRWINIAGFSIQPSELAKPLLIGWFSSYLSKEGIGNFIEFIIDLSLIILPCGIILFQPDLGSAGLIFISLAVLLFWHKPNLKWWGPVIAIGLIIVVVGWTKILEPYQIDRITSFFNPGIDPLGKGYNQIQAKIAIGAGGWFGRGFGLGRQTQLAFLPEKQTDFILAAIGEELGFIGILFSLGLYFYLFFWLVKKIQTAKNLTEFNYRLGIFTLLFLQTAFNIAMNLQLFPIVGLPLPLLSYGGSSLISTLIGLSLI